MVCVATCTATGITLCNLPANIMPCASSILYSICLVHECMAHTWNGPLCFLLIHLILLFFPAVAAGPSGPAPTSIALADGCAVVRRVIDSDNSCLFNAVGYVMDGRDRKAAKRLRAVIAEVGRVTAPFLRCGRSPHLNTNTHSSLHGFTTFKASWHLVHEMYKHEVPFLIFITQTPCLFMGVMDLQAHLITADPVMY